MADEGRRGVDGVAAKDGTAAPARDGTAVVLDPVAALEERLGLTFADRGRALAALTHKSWVNEHREVGGEDNERLEFLGDAVVDLLASHRLMERFPGAREGELSKMRAAVVDETGLAAIARELRLGEILRLGRGEELTGGREKASLLADAMEAVFAAVYLEGSLASAQSILDRFLHETYARASAGTLDRDFKTQLQEVCQSRFRLSPRYRVCAEHGPDHLKIFDIEVSVSGEVVGRGSGRSKKDAEQVAARQALDVLAKRPAWWPGPGAAPDASAEAAAVPAATAAPAPSAPAPEAVTRRPPGAPAQAPAAEARPAKPVRPKAAPRKAVPKVPARPGVARKGASADPSRPRARRRAAPAGPTKRPGAQARTRPAQRTPGGGAGRAPRDKSRA